MKTELYEDITTNKLMIFDDIKEQYAELNNSDLPIDNATMHLIIMEQLVQNGGNLKLINDRILKWCNDYLDYNEAERYLSQMERDLSARNIYENISSKDMFCKELKKYLIDDTEGKRLLERLDKLL